MSWYKEGSVNIEQGSKTVTGIGTKWTNPLIGVCTGQMLILKTANAIEIYEIASVQSDTQLTLANQYSGASKTGVSYEIPTAPNVSIEALALRISEMLNYYQQQMNGWQLILTGTGDITLTAPDGRVVTIKSQRALTEAINNAIKKSGETNQSISGSLNVDELTEKGKRVYSPNNKPKPSDIGALAVIIGDHRLMPFRANELPFGWYFRNGDNYLLSSPQGQVLNSLSANYKSDHRITIKTIAGKQYINVPNAFHSDGRGLFERPVNGVTRQVGHIEDDKIRNITGGFGMDGIAGANAGVVWGGYGPFYENGTNNSIAKYAPSEIGVSTKMGFDLSRATSHTGPETTVINEGKTPAIYLGV